MTARLKEAPVRLDARAAARMGEHLGEDVARVSGLRGGKALRISAEGMTLASTSDLIPEIAARSSIRSMKPGGERGRANHTIIAIDSVVSNPSGIAVAASPKLWIVSASSATLPDSTTTTN